MAAKRIILPGYLSRAGCVRNAGYRSMLAFWLGGACASAFIPPEPEPPSVRGGGGVRKRKRAEDWLERIKRDDEEILMLIPELWVVIHHEQ